mmetsp:Transcript_88198/g.234512  ORF Transcript_88198/g.234512 Transcript_88198/m.234512 type:complete len:350 (+) Transcript_88198:34-1083(+)
MLSRASLLSVWKAISVGQLSVPCIVQASMHVAVQSRHPVAKAMVPARALDRSRCFSRTAQKPSKGTEEEEIKSLEVLRAKAADGNIAAQFNLGQAYLNGHHGLTPSPKDATHWIQKAAEGGSSEAQFFMGVHSMNGTGIDKNVQKAIEWFKLSAAQGTRAAHFNLGLIYEEGNGVPRDATTAAQHYAEAVAGDDLHAAVKLARLHLAGDGVERDLKTATDLLRKPANKGIPEAQLAFGLLQIQGGTPGERKRGLEMVEQAAEGGNTQAMHLLGASLVEGFWGTKDEAKGLPWLQKAAASGNPQSQFILYQRLSKGKGMEKEALSWLQKAAAAGHPEALKRLAETRSASA